MVLTPSRQQESTLPFKLSHTFLGRGSSVGPRCTVTCCRTRSSWTKNFDLFFPVAWAKLISSKMFRKQQSKACFGPICMLSPKARQIRQMFSSIAPRYDLLNHLLSLNIDKSWRRKAVSLMRSNTSQQQSLWLDLCCGTGDLSLEMVRQGARRIISSDFSHPMLRLNLDKVRHRGAILEVSVIEADALALPFPANTFDAVAIAFGLRNLESAESGLTEMNRVLKPGGRVVVLEFSKPTNAWFDRLFQRYFFNVLPRIGATLSRHHHAYTYLPESVSRFPNQANLAALFTACGFDGVGYQNLTGGIAAIHWGEKQGRV